MPPEMQGAFLFAGCEEMDLLKKKPIRLRGKKLAELNKEIHKRDGCTCIIKGCGRHVALEEKFHHVILKSQRGSDTIENGVTLCLYCHTEAHGKNGKALLNECREYISGIYGG